VSARVLDAIRSRIAADGPIDFATYMNLALYGDGGYYERPPIGAGGDFVTSPHVHPVFGTLVARALAELAGGLPGEATVRLSEVGAGDGTLARQIIAEGVGRPFAYTAVEVGAGARSALADVPGVIVASSLARADLVLAHELLDNLPFRVVRGDREIRVDVHRDRLVEAPTQIDTELRALIGDVATAEDELVVPTGALSFVDELANALKDGYALLIDYGHDEGGGPVHGYRSHRPVADVLATPGETDITAGVDFGWVARHAAALGLRAFPTVSQRAALMALGFEDWYRDALASQQSDLAAGRGVEAVRTWSGRSMAMVLVDPTQLGRHRWLVLATPHMPQPPWLTRALED
jgi:NADH dehydrogenase [ubiquinone] 1 alpha subcomplex assembly factor 7